MSERVVTNDAKASPCPLCGSGESVVVTRFTANEAAQHFVLREQEPQRHQALSRVIERLWDAPQGSNRSCASCGFGFADPFVAGDMEFYSIALDESGYPTDKWEFRQTLEAMKDLDLDGKDILEIGAGDGYFLDQLDAKVAPARRHALEYNAASVERMLAKSYRATLGDLASLRGSGKKYGAIFMFQVLEHRDKIHDTFELLRELIADDGRIYIAVPNAAQTRFNEENGSLLDMPPNHIGRWTEENFSTTAAQHRLRVTNMAKEPFAAVDFVKMDLIYSFMRRAQRRGTLANRLYPRRKSPLGRIAVAGAVTLNGLRRLPVWLRGLGRTSDLGTSLWVELRPHP